MGFRNGLVSGLTLVREAIQSLGYLTGISGWSIKRDGSAEFQNIVARGDIQAGTLLAGTPGGARMVVTAGGALEIYNAANQLVAKADPTGIYTIKPGGQQIRFDPTSTFPTIRFRSADGTQESYINAAADGVPGVSDSWLGLNTAPFMSSDGIQRSTRLWLRQDRVRLELIRSSNQVQQGGFVQLHKDTAFLGVLTDLAADEDNWFVAKKNGLELRTSPNGNIDVFMGGRIQFWTSNPDSSTEFQRDGLPLLVPINSRKFNGVIAGNRTTAPSGYTDIPGMSLSFTKRYDDTLVAFGMAGNGYLDIGTLGAIGVGARINGVDYDVFTIAINAGGHHESGSGFQDTGGFSIPRGTYTVQGRWKGIFAVGGTERFTTDFNDRWSLQVQEINP